MILDNKFNIGDTIYVITDQEQLPRIVTQLEITRSEIVYVCYQSTNVSRHYDFEMSKEKTLVM